MGNLAVNTQLTKWRAEKENRDGTGFTYYQCQCPQVRNTGPLLDHLYGLCYAPSLNRIWFWDEKDEDSESIKLTCDSWDEAEMLKKMLTTGKSHWMEPNNE